jgi:hypothetical protein
MRRIVVYALVFIPTLAFAQQVPDEITKRKALMRAYHLNDDSMVRLMPYGSIDLSHEDWSTINEDGRKVVKTFPVPKQVKRQFGKPE